ncbi:MAG TPA: 50S ribosomal protein L13 [Fusibacter sp.]|nr:50S ribosomal protein L13 [Fusibacter sp.]
MKSYVAKPLEIERKWYVVDADGKTLGRLAAEVAKILRGKHKPIFTPHVDTGDFVIVVNAEKIRVTGNKMDDKKYRWHTGYVGNLQERSFREMNQRHPERVIELAIKGMLPHNSLGSQMYTKLKVYAGSEHKHEAQKPEVLEIQG